MDFYFENSLLALDLGKKMSASGEKLEELGGIAGATTVSDNGRTANGASKFLTQAYQTGLEAYDTLKKAYGEGEDVSDKDFTDAKDTIVAEHAIATMKTATAEVLGLAAEIHFLNQLAYPISDEVVFGDAPDSADAMAAMMARVRQAKKDGKDTFQDINFREVPYALGETTFEPEASSCTGPTIGSPIMGMGLAGCAAACDATVAPDNCLAFALYAVGSDSKDVCVLSEDVKAVETFNCEGSGGSGGSAAA